MPEDWASKVASTLPSVSLAWIGWVMVTPSTGSAINSGFNLRPTDIQAAIAHNQFKRLDVLKRNREINRKLIINKLTKSKLWNNQFEFINPAKKISPSWMGLPILLSKKFKHKKKKFINF